MKLSQLKPNPSNPRIIRDDKFIKLVESLRSFPEMMEKRPMVCVTDVDGKLFPLGGNMRLRAIQELGMKDIPDTWVTLADDWTEEKRKEFTIKDNASFGEWDWDDLANKWDADLLEDWGVDVPDMSNITANGEEIPIDETFELAPDLGIERDYLVIVFKSTEEYEDAKNVLGLKKMTEANVMNQDPYIHEQRVMNYEDLRAFIK